MKLALVKEFVPKWGHVMIHDEHGRVTKEYAISAKELNDVHCAKSFPACCTQGEWLSGRVRVVGRTLLPGECIEGADGALYVNASVRRERGGGIKLLMFRFPRDQWAMVGGDILTGKGQRWQ